MNTLPVCQYPRSEADAQAHHPLPKTEWQAVLAQLCYGHLASTNFLDSWLVKHNRRMEHWEQIAMTWTRLVPERFRLWHKLEQELLELFQDPSQVTVVGRDN
ncbi:hypothetical protein P4V64_22605 [Bacillus thuringiensis]|nr:hypothetical protein [Bacillus thuringiensis]